MNSKDDEKIIHKCRICKVALGMDIRGNGTMETREQKCPKCGGGFRWTMYKKHNKTHIKLYEVMPPSEGQTEALGTTLREAIEEWLTKNE